MKIFLTGATGFVGRAIARAARAAGHEVAALVHDARGRAEVERLGYAPAMGDLRDGRTLHRHAAVADAVVHAANTGGADAAAVDEAATRAMVAALQDGGRPFVYTSGVWVLGPTGDGAADEDAPLRPLPIVAWRAQLEHWLRRSVGPGVRSVIVRPGIVYGDGGGIPGRVGRGELPIVGDGGQLWPLVHRDDLAALYLAAIERAPAGSVLHAVAHHRTASEVWAAHATGRRPERLPLAEARLRLGAFADALALGQHVASRATRALTGWTPSLPAPA